VTAETGSDQRRFRDALGTFATGVTIVTTRSGDLVHGMTANGFMSVSLEPALVVVAIAAKARMHDLLLESRRYGVSVLACGQEDISHHFAGRVQEGSEIALVDVQDTPLVDGALTHVLASVVDAHEAGDHTLFVGEVLHFEHRPGEPLIFHSGAYRSLVGAPGDLTRSDEWAGELHTWALHAPGSST
jgi:flavin reductase (DIM6/NTAB) family NADH-FMN oxidoreductase RutF